MRNLTKFQKIIILITIFLELFICNVNYNSYRNRFNFSDFLLMSFPVILYWSVTWVCGFGTFRKIFKVVYNFIKNNILQKINYKYLACFVLAVALAYIIYAGDLTISDLVDSRATEKAIGGALAGGIVASLCVFMKENGAWDVDSNENEETGKQLAKNNSKGFLVISIVLICMMYFFVMNYKDTREKERVKMLNYEIKKVSTYLGWKWKETEVLYDFCQKYGYKLDNYRSEFFNLTQQEETRLQQLHNKLKGDELRQFYDLLKQAKIAIVKEAKRGLYAEFEMIKSQDENVQIKDLCKMMDDNAREILTNTYHNDIKRKMDGNYTQEELQRVKKVMKENNLSVK